MSIMNYLHLKHEGSPAYPNYAILPLPAESGMKIENSAGHTFQMADSGKRSIHRNEFFEGLLYSLPICVLLWGIIFWVLHAILF